jgi:hypothetical protein
MELESSLTHLQVPATCPYPEPDQSSPCPPSHPFFLKIRLHPDHFTYGKRTRYSWCRRQRGPQGQSGWVRKNLAFTGVPTPDRPARSESLYRLGHRGRNFFMTSANFTISILCDVEKCLQQSVLGSLNCSCRAKL